MDKIAFVVITWNSQKFIEECLTSIINSTLEKDVHIWVVDNGSIDHTVELIQKVKKEKKESKLHIIKNDKNLGTAVSRNQALKEIRQWSQVQYVCILDSDTKVNSQSIDMLIKALYDVPSAMIASPRMHNNNDKMQISAKRFPTLRIKLLKGMPVKAFSAKGEILECYDFDNTDIQQISKCKKAVQLSSNPTIYEVDFTISACWMLRAEALDIVGLLDEKIFYSPEDVDYCARVHESGYKVILVYDALIKHHTQRISKRKLFSVMNLHHIRGLIYFYFKHRGKLI